MSKKKKHEEHHEEGHGGDERWLLTYADMITLLLALFIVLFASSTINQKKFAALALGFKEAFDPKPGLLQNSNGVLAQNSLVKTEGNIQTNQPSLTVPPSQMNTSDTGAAAAAAGQAQLSSLQQKVAQALQAKGLGADVSTSKINGQLVIRLLNDNVFFQSDSADLGAVGQQVVDTVSSALASSPNMIDVNGYTDTAAITGGPYTSNEELSAVRAVNVVLRMEQSDGVSAGRLAATGFGASRPVAPNTTPQNMALNRRIDIVVLAQAGS